MTTIAENKEHIMKKTAALLMALGLTLPAISFSQDANQQRPPRGQRPAQQNGGPGNQPDRAPGNRDEGPGADGPRRPVPPLMAALDTNHDGVIDADEIKNASAALLKLDKNGDGKLTMDELRPPRPDGADGNQRGPQVRGDDRNGPPDGQGPQRRGPRPPEGQ